MEKMRRSSPAASLFIFTLITALISRNLVIPVISSTNIEDPHAGSPPSVPSYSSPPPPGCSDGGYNPTPPTPSSGNGGSLPHHGPSPTPSNPPSSSPSSYGDGRPKATPTDPGTPTVSSSPSCLPFPSPFTGTCSNNSTNNSQLSDFIFTILPFCASAIGQFRQLKFSARWQ